MDAYRIGVKLFIGHPEQLDRSKFVPMFHGWIQAQALPGHQLIDVADYHHVPKNPSVVLVAHEATLSLEETDSPLALLYARKRPLGGTFPQRLGTVIGAALNACQRMEHDTTAGQIKFQTNQIILRLLDRLHAPNDDRTLELVQPDVSDLFQILYDAGFMIERNPDDRLPFEIKVSSSTSPSIDKLLQRLSAWREPFIHS